MQNFLYFCVIFVARGRGDVHARGKGGDAAVEATVSRLRLYERWTIYFGKADSTRQRRTTCAERTEPRTTTKLKEKKLRIPDDVAVMGFCGFPGGSLQNPPLATVDEDYATFGKIAAEKLCAPELWFNKSSFNTWNEIPYKILTRASIGKKSNSQ